ncbi:MAG: hypothetical protein GY710_02415, partial [Desulfobacteraceae bacterium]|nr:hypothetical protein [Desulfobacteraceae bacterium]
IAKRLGIDQKTIHNHLGKMPVLANLLNTDLSQGFTVAQVAQKHGWTDSMVWSLALEGKGAILIDDYLRILNKTGWQHIHIIQAPMSAQRFSAIVVSAMQKKRSLLFIFCCIFLFQQL